ncbi:hypothetical protein FFRU_070490 [Fructobacillus fructosus]|uniref:DUF1056 family protein n=1 Tax=Fructobacillus fructosus TaxID=1631 RepID=UPI00021957ED|nr:DUF1056 family protein [Fructobacillus fructosus]KRN52321.1 hypothetical protein IV71_GL001369 [Fructobacillus fructosus KCTC 3544]GAP01405.1 hypothetical protein FFRU_070490 [Fructobacillus fructosus]
MQSLGKYLPFILIVLGMLAISYSAMMISMALGWLVVGLSLCTVAYILSPKGGKV